MNDDLIKRSDAIKAVDKAEIWSEAHFVPDWDRARQYIDKLPSADRPHGKWVWDKDAIDWDIGAWCCSECQSRNDNIPHYPMTNPLIWHGTKYCPNCGADMRGIDDE